MTKYANSSVSIRRPSEFSVVYGSVAANDKEIALLTRSVLEILSRSLLLH